MLQPPSLELTVAIFLIVYGAFMFFFIIYSLFNIYHLIRYGFYDFSLYILVTVFTGGTILLVAVSAFQMMQYDWTHSLSVDKGIEFFNEELFPGL